MPKRHVLKNSNFLSDEAVKSLLAKEALIRGDAEAEAKTNEGFISSSGNVFYVFFTWKVSDSTSSCDYSYRFAPATKQDDPFGDEESLRNLYAEFADDEIALANEGLSDFHRIIKEYDGE